MGVPAALGIGGNRDARGARSPAAGEVALTGLCRAPQKAPNTLRVCLLPIVGAIGRWFISPQDESTALNFSLHLRLSADFAIDRKIQHAANLLNRPESDGTLRDTGVKLLPSSGGK